jgi:hypothetical protein
MPRIAPTPLPFAAALTLALGAVAQPAAAAPQRLSVYSGGFEAVTQAGGGRSQAGYALVQRPLRVRDGELALDDLPLALDASTAQLRGEGVRVRSQRYDFAGLDQSQLLQRAVGSEISVEQITPAGVRAFTGVLVAVGSGLTLREGDGTLRVLSGYSGFTLAQAPQGLVSRPTLRFLVDAEGERDATLDYATAGLAWRAEYRADLRGDGRQCSMRLEGHAMVANRSGTDFRDVALSLVAGEPNRRIDAVEVSGTMVRAAPMEMKMMAADSAPEVSASADYHRYTLPGTGDLPDGSLQRLPLLDAATAVPCERRYEARRDDGDWLPDRPMVQRELGRDGDMPVRTRLAFRNDRAAGLGAALPAGRVRSFLDGELLGEADLGHTAAGRDVALDLGTAFDLSTARRTTAFALDRAGRTITETVEWTLRNGKATPAVVNVEDRLPRWSDWQLVEGAGPFKKKDAQRIEAAVTVPASSETVLRYTVRYRWADDVTID